MLYLNTKSPQYIVMFLGVNAVTFVCGLQSPSVCLLYSRLEKNEFEFLTLITLNFSFKKHEKIGSLNIFWEVRDVELFF